MTPPPSRPSASKSSSARPSAPRALAGGGYVKKSGPNAGGKSSGGGAPSGRAKAAFKGSFDRAPKRGAKPKGSFEARTPREGFEESAASGEKKAYPRKPGYEGHSARGGVSGTASPRSRFNDGDKKPFVRGEGRGDKPAYGAKKTFGPKSSSESRTRSAAPKRSYQAFDSKLEKSSAPRHEGRPDARREGRPVAPRTGARPLSCPVAARSKDDALWLEPGEKGAHYPVGIPWVVGRNAVLAILKQSPKRIIKLFMAEGMGTERRLKAIQETAHEHGLTIQYVERPELDKRCEQLDDPDIAHQGVLAEVLPKDALTLYELIDKLKATKDVEGLTPATQPLIIALDKITDPRNVGAILRVADGVGAMAVIMPKRHQAGWGPALSKSASGADATVDIVMVPNLVMALKDLKEAGGWVVGAAGEEDTELYTDYKFDRPTVLVMGSEGDGLSRLTRATCDYLVRIPMMGAMTSLNVSTATAVLAYGWRAATQPS